jgi:hypothetical protein
MTLRLGYFENFKGGNVVLLTADREDVPLLRKMLEAAMTEAVPFAIHEVAAIARRHLVRLFVCPTAVSFRSSGGEWVWRLTVLECLDVDSKLQLLERMTGHQYFDIEGARAQLMVSVGEYDANWWQRVEA